MPTTRTFYVLIDRNNKGDLLFSLLLGRSTSLEREADAGLFPLWNFGHSPSAEEMWNIHVYGRAFGHLPTGAEAAIIQGRILTLIQETGV